MMGKSAMALIVVRISQAMLPLRRPGKNYNRNLIYNSTLIHAHSVLRRSVPRSLRRTFSFRNAFVRGLYEQSTARSIPPSLPQISATVGGRGAEKMVTVRLPCVRV